MAAKKATKPHQTKAAKPEAKAAKANTGKKAPAKRAKPKPRTPKAPIAGEKLSASAAAAKVLAEAKGPLRAKEIVEQMAENGYWTSPGGKTPEATIVAVMLREIRDKGNQSRFQKAGRGLFAANS